jgi:hypothetical protein
MSACSRGRSSGTYPDLVAAARLGKVADPLDARVPGRLEDLEEADNEPARGEHKHLEVDVDWRARPRCARRRCGQLAVRCERAFLSALQAWDPARRYVNGLSARRKGHPRKSRTSR